MRRYDVVIIGAGPSGAGAAIQSSINGLKVLLLEKDEVGGRIKLARRIENLMLDRAVDGNTAAEYLRERIYRMGINLLREEAISIKSVKDGYITYTAKDKYFSRAIILATGLIPKIPDIYGLEEMRQRGRVFFSWRDMKRESDSPVLIIGAGEVGCDSACSLKESGFEPILFTRSESLNVNYRLVKDIKSLGIRVIKGVLYKEIYEKSGIVILVIERKGRVYKYRGRAILITTGGEPNLNLLKGVPKKDLILICGDANPANYHQASIAFGDGINAAMRLTQILSGRMR